MPRDITNRAFSSSMLFSLLLLLQACGTAAKPVPLDVAIRGIAEDLKNAGVASIADGFNTQTGPANPFDVAVVNSQCFFRTANPTIPVMVKDFNLELQGTFTAGGKFSVSGIPAPTAGVEATITSAQQQKITVPVAFTSISNLPNVYIAQSLTYITGLPEADKTKFVKNLLEDAERLKVKITNLVRLYPTMEPKFPKDPQDCPKSVFTLIMNLAQ